jgi:hypothetical protein
MRNRAIRPLLFASTALLGAPAAMAADIGDVKVTWGGYIKLDTLYSHYSDGAVAQGIGRDTYVPGTIPVVADADEDSASYLDFHAKETRLFLKAETMVEGHKLGGHVEFDFIVNQGGANEVATNAYNPGMRRAFITYDNWLLGQEWSTFVNLTALPEALDFVAFPTDGTVFMRQPMVRYTQGGLSVALENPESTVAANGATSFDKTDQNNTLPDLIARYSFKVGGADLAVAGMLRQIVDKGAVGSVDDKTEGYGVSFTGKIPLGSDDIRFMINGGEGIGRYLALNTVGDAVVNGDGELDAVQVINGYVVLHHPWTAKTRSNLGLSHLSADTDGGDLGAGTTEKVSSAFVNLLYSPVSKLTFGGELRYAERETVAGLKGDLTRLQFSAKYMF